MTRTFANIFEAAAMVGEFAAIDQAPTLLPHEVEDIVRQCQTIDSEGREVTDTNYVLTVETSLAASKLWAKKAAKAAGMFDFKTDNQSFSRSQVLNACLQMQLHFQKQIVASWANKPVPTAERFELGSEWSN